MDDDSTVIKTATKIQSLSAFQTAVGDSSRKENRVLKKRKDGLVWRFGIPGEWPDVLFGILDLAWQGCYGLSEKWNSSAHFEVCYAYCYRDSFCSVVEINAVDGAVDCPVVCPKWDLVTPPETHGASACPKEYCRRICILAEVPETS